MKSKDEIRETVRAGYADIAAGKKTSCCGGGCGRGEKRSNHSNPKRLAQTLGYDAKKLAKLPAGANMGLSCGNPVAMAALKKGQVVIDLGSGGGFDVFQAGPKVGKSGRAIGVDMTPEMISKARKNISFYKKMTGLDNAEFRLGEIENIPAADGVADVIISNCVINLSPDKPRVWKEIYRVLKRGGKAAVSDLALLKPLPKNVQEKAAALVGCVAGAVLVKETESMLEKSGFKRVKLTPKPDYVKNMLAWNDPLYKEISASLPKGAEMSDYIVSLSVEAYK